MAVKYKASEQARRRFEWECTKRGMAMEDAIEAMGRHGRMREAVWVTFAVPKSLGQLTRACPFTGESGEPVSRQSVYSWDKRGLSKEAAIGFVWWLATLEALYGKAMVESGLEGSPEIDFEQLRELTGELRHNVGVSTLSYATYYDGRAFEECYEHAFTATLRGALTEDEWLLDVMEAMYIICWRMGREKVRAFLTLFGGERFRSDGGYWDGEGRKRDALREELTLGAIKSVLDDVQEVVYNGSLKPGSPTPAEPPTE